MGKNLKYTFWTIFLILEVKWLVGSSIGLGFFKSELPPKMHRHHSFLHAVRKSTSEVKQLGREREKRWNGQVYIEI